MHASLGVVQKRRSDPPTWVRPNATVGASRRRQQDLVNEWYADNTQLKNMETGNLFERTNVNPLAGCLPSLAQIPVFLGVYYSVTSIAKAKVSEVAPFRAGFA
jgi:hypothetical protein